MEKLYSVEDLAAYLGLPLATIYRYNYLGTAPPRVKIGRHVRYRESDVERWLESLARSSAGSVR